MTAMSDESDLPEEDRAAAYTNINAPSNLDRLVKKGVFAPWHHPVKQIVRIKQWSALTKILIERRTSAIDTLRYFTLPGADLLDVKVLADICFPRNIKIEYFGFNSSRPVDGIGENHGEVSTRLPWTAAEAALRQGNKITANAEIASDRLEDIAVINSKAEASLRQRPVFDVVNIDACNHLGDRPPGRNKTTFDALNVLLRHQLKASSPWLLFVTTRASSNMLGLPGLEFQQAVNRNVTYSPDEFGPALAEALGCGVTAIASSMTAAWSAQGEQFFKMYSIGVVKYLLQYFHQQPNCQANVELVSSYVYRVQGEELDMAALAFRISPDPVKAYPPNIGVPVSVAQFEATRACAAARRAGKLWNIDAAISSDNALRDEAVRGTEALLDEANFDILAWRAWISAHPIRPIQVTTAP